MFRNTMLAWSREKKPAQPMVKHTFEIHVWGAINFKGKVGLYVFTENLDRHLYRQILNEQLYDNADALPVFHATTRSRLAFIQSGSQSY